MTDQDNLINVNCPLRKVGKYHGLTYVCGRLAVRVSPNSYGEAWCQRCKKNFYFEVNADAVTVAPRRVKAKPTKTVAKQEAVAKIA